MNLQMELHRAFKKLDPAFESTFNLWYLSRFSEEPGHGAASVNGWRGYKDYRSVIDAHILDRDVLIAMAPGRGGPKLYPVDEARNIRAAGYRTALWTWYRGDYETRANLHSHLRCMDCSY